MPRDIAPLTNGLNETTPGNQNDIYSLLAAWNKSIEAALEHGGGNRFREVMKQYHARVIDLVDVAATNEGIDWAFLEDAPTCIHRGVGDHYCSSVLANVVARCVIRTWVTADVSSIPSWALNYLAALTSDEDGDWAFESAGVYGWGVGHPDVAVIDWTVERAETEDDWAILDILEHVAFADPHAAITLLERLLRSPDVTEDIEYLGMLESPLEQNFPDFPEHWEPHTELDYSVSFTDDQIDRLLALLGDTIPADRLRYFDQDFAFDLQRAADEYGSDAPA